MGMKERDHGEKEKDDQRRVKRKKKEKGMSQKDLMKWQGHGRTKGEKKEIKY